MTVIRNKDTGDMYCFDIPMFKQDNIEELLNDGWEVVKENLDNKT